MLYLQQAHSHTCDLYMCVNMCHDRFSHTCDKQMIKHTLYAITWMLLKFLCASAGFTREGGGEEGETGKIGREERRGKNVNNLIWS